MNSLVRDKGYKKLLADIAILYSNARSVLVQTYWEIGKRIVEQEQSGSDKPEYGSHLIEQLSVDLSEQFGEGFSRRNVFNFRRFYLTHKKVQPAAQLDWSQYVELLPARIRPIIRITTFMPIRPKSFAIYGAAFKRSLKRESRISLAEALMFA